MTKTDVGTLVRHWRHQRSRSQLDVAYDVGVSPKHLSFVETGRSRPSPELIDAIGVHLDIPLRERNTMLLAAGFAPRYRHTSLDDPSMSGVAESLQRLLDTHDPYPGLVLDRHWNVVLANRGARALAALLPEHLAGPPMNVFRASLHPDGLAAHTLDFDRWATHLLTQLHRLVAVTGDPGLVEIEGEVIRYPNIVELLARTDWSAATGAPELLIPYRLDLDGIELSMFTTLTTFGTPRDITLDELAVELFFPNDAVTADHFRRSPTTQEHT
ncbi:MAG: helix-turn-helix transcriptional regulator [Ilumatobacter sp.]|uniref:helix-turn-helix domain-containing protein n=1 Tax=Ilumatobacter sp. TaxID=1967498 RepID=UPI00329A3A45